MEILQQSTIDLGIKALDTREKFERWLNTEIVGLNNKKPIDCTEEEIINTLVKIEFGTY